MVARGAGAAGPVLLACPQSYPLGLALRLPSLGVGAWRSAPLLPWRVQCPIRVCAGLAAGSGGSGRYLALCLSRFPHPAPRVPRCVWRAVPSGCPLPSLAGTRFHAVCAFPELGPVALLVVPVCPWRVCTLALPWRPPPPPWVVWCVHLGRSRHWALVGPFHVVRAPPRVLPRSLAPSGLLGGGGPVLVPPYLAWGCCCEGCLRSGASPPPTARPLGGLLGSATHVLWARLCGFGGPTLSPWPVCPVGAVCRGGGVVGGRPGGGWPATVVRGVWCQALSLPRPPVLWGGEPGFRGPCVPGAVGAGVGTQHRPDGARPCGPALRAVGVAEGRPPGAAVRRCEGRLGSGAPRPPTARPLGGLPGPTTHWLCVRGGVRAWGPVTNPTARALASWPCALWGRLEGARGGRLLPGCGASGVGRSPTPYCPPSGGASGAHYPLAVGAGGCGRGNPSPTPQRALLRAVGAA